MLSLHLLEYLSQIELPEVESHCKILEGRENILRDKRYSEHGRIADREQDKIFQKSINSFVILHFFDLDLFIEYLVQIFLGWFFPDLKLNDLLLIDIFLLSIMHKLLFHPLILSIHSIPLLALLNNLNIPIVVDNLGGQQTFMETHLVIKALDQMYPFLAIVHVISHYLAD